VRLPLHEVDLDLIPLLSEPFAIVLSKQHRLRVQANISVRDLKHEQFVAYTEGQAPAFFQHWTGICRRAGFTPRIVQEVSEMETAVTLVAAGVGVGILPEGVARRYSRSLVVRSLREERVRSEIGLAFLKANPPSVAQQLIASVSQSGLLPPKSRKRSG
jgi:LysR family transcriptional regulator, benzoate and cis,cis-muconate-responsive activator of ben and cat genes